MSTNKNRNAAKRAKNDEFYTRRSCVEAELRHYTSHLHGATVLCNCDDPRRSQFVTYFAYKFHKFHLKELLATCYMSTNPDGFSAYDSDRGLSLSFSGKMKSNGTPDWRSMKPRSLSGNGSFSSDECVALLQDADFVVTNPPFSLFREYIALLLSSGKKFIVMGPLGAICYKEVFSEFQKGNLWLGVENRSKTFDTPSGPKTFGNVGWFTNVAHGKTPGFVKSAFLYKAAPKEYPKYDNFDAIEVGRVAKIPLDFKGMMGVPESFILSYNPKQFELVGTDRQLVYEKTGKVSRFYLAGREKPCRLVIRNRRATCRSKRT